MRLRCPAKINLHLRVGRRRATDGFHPLLTWMATVGLFDTLTVEALQPPEDEPDASTAGVMGRAARPPSRYTAQQGYGDGPPPGGERAGVARILLLSSDLPGLPDDGTNLVVRAAEAFAAAIVGRGDGDVGCATGGQSAGGAARAAGADVQGGNLSRRTAATAAADDHHAPAPRAGGPQSLEIGEGPGSSPAAGGCDASTGSSAERPSVAAADVAAWEGERATPAPMATTTTGASRADDEVGGQRPTPRGGEATPAGVRPVAAALGKAIPLGAGLGGGSSDAARTLVGLNRLWQANWPPERLAAVAAQLGSDVPFFLFGPSSICTGRGEVVRPVSRPRVARWAVLVLPDIHMPTAAVYRRFDEMGLGFDDDIAREPDWSDWATRPAKELLGGLVNDLEAPAFDIRQDLGTLRAGIELELQRPVRMSGSGSSLFTLFDDGQEAERAAARISARFAVKALAVEMAPDVADDGV